MVNQDWFEKDFYAILGVSKDVDAKELKKVYRKLARQHHPDSNPGDKAAEQKFKDVGEAYAVLSDPEQRKQYDAVRAMGGGARFTAGAGGPGGAGGFEDVFAQMFGGGAGAQNVRFSTGGQGGIDLEDLLGAFAGGGFGEGQGFPGGGQGFPGGGGQGFPGGGGQGFPGAGRRGPVKGQDVQASTSLDFRSAATGETITLSKPDGGTITTRIPAGVKDGQRIRLKGKGLPAPGTGGEPGDMYLTVSVRPHPVFGREGDDLTVDLPVTFAEAALGATVEVPTLDGSTVRVRIAPGTPSGRVLRVKGRGIQAARGAGDLLARVQVMVPQRLSDRAREAVEVLRTETGSADPRADLMQRARA